MMTNFRKIHFDFFKSFRLCYLSQRVSCGGQNIPQFLGVDHAVVVFIKILEGFQDPIVGLVLQFLKESDKLLGVVDDQTIVIRVGSIHDPLDVALGGVVANAL